MTFEDLRELIQDDIITVMDSYKGLAMTDLLHDRIIDALCQIVVDRFKEYDVSSSDITT